VKQHPRLVIFGAAAAIALVVGGIGLEKSGRVSADDVFAHLKTALKRSVSMRIEGVDLGNAAIHGEIILNKPTRWDTENDYYSEIHVLLKADNPEWNDLDAVGVVCQTPRRAWRYCRGNGGIESDALISGRRLNVTPTEEFHGNVDFVSNWIAFGADPAGVFSPMPLVLSFDRRQGEKIDQVKYTFPTVQRRFVRNLTRFLVSLSDAQTTDALIDELRRATAHLKIEKIGADQWVLHANGIGQLEALALVLPSDDSIATALKSLIWEFTYDDAAGRITSSAFGERPALLRDVDFQHDWNAFLTPDEQSLGIWKVEPWKGPLNEVAERLSTVCGVVTRRPGPAQGQTILRMTGVPVTLDEAALSWARRAQEQMQKMQLSVYFGGPDKSVTSVEINHVASASGKIILTVGEKPLGEDRLNPARWTTLSAKNAEPSEANDHSTLGK